MTLITSKHKKGTIGERSRPPIGGINPLKGAKIGSVTSFRNLNGCFHQSIFGNHVKSILSIITSQIS